MIVVGFLVLEKLKSFRNFIFATCLQISYQMSQHWASTKAGRNIMRVFWDKLSFKMIMSLKLGSYWILNSEVRGVQMLSLILTLNTAAVLFLAKAFLWLLNVLSEILFLSLLFSLCCSTAIFYKPSPLFLLNAYNHLQKS